MNRYVPLVSVAVLWAGCTEERVIYDNTPNAKFAAMMGGSRNASGDVTGAWQVSGHDVPNKPASEQAQRIAAILRGQIASPKPLPADTPSNLKITTSFDLADPPNPPSGGPTQGLGDFMNSNMPAAPTAPMPAQISGPSAAPSH